MCTYCGVVINRNTQPAWAEARWRGMGWGGVGVGMGRMGGWVGARQSGVGRAAWAEARRCTADTAFCKILDQGRMAKALSLPFFFFNFKRD